jgi:ribonuclease HII
MIIIGTDEAGYGPNLGPLVVSATVWESPTENLMPILAPLKSQGISIGDSKKIYHGNQSLVTLEYGVLASHYVLGRNQTPLIAEKELLQKYSVAFRRILSENAIQLLDIQSRSISPEEFNQLLDRFVSKGSLLSDTTMQLVVNALGQQHHFAPILVLCDKHGGRNHYLDLLTEYFPGEFIQTLQEGRACSIYRLSHENRSLEFRFLAKGESQVPIALASMNSKYLREQAMLEFNAFWQEKMPSLKPTAGYPEDAKRFIEEINLVRKKLGIADDKIWRKR